MTTREAFRKLLAERGSFNRVGKSKGEFGAYRDRIKNEGKYPSEALMRQLLEKAGFRIIQERKWEIKK